MAEWAASGAMALTGFGDGAPGLVRGAPTTLVQTSLAALHRLHPRIGFPGIEMLGERAAIAGLKRNAPYSVGGAFRLLPTAEGRLLGLSLPRESDRELIPALVASERSTLVAESAWETVTEWAARTPALEAEERAILLGLPAALVPDNPSRNRPGVLATRGGDRTASHAGRDRPLVIDLSAMWAGPLCAHLLGLAGARVIKVESTARPDGARFGPSAFYDLLHCGHESVVLDFHDATDLAFLRQLAITADVVIESSRPHALRRLGIDATAAVAAGVIWLSITGYGRGQPMRVGFGDDVAAGAGLVATALDSEGHEWTVPAGDALADPLAGITAAASVAQALAASSGVLLDLSMHDVAAQAAVRRAHPKAPRVARTDEGFASVSASLLCQVAEPVPRFAPASAAPPGEHTAAIRAEFGGAR